MKFLLLTLCLMAASANAKTCIVDLVDSWTNYRYESFSSNSPSGACLEAQEDCKKTKKERKLNGADCIERKSEENSAEKNKYEYLLTLSNRQLATRALNQRIGSCIIVRGKRRSRCDHYVKASYKAFPSGSGCAERAYTQNIDCNFHNKFENAGCVIRRAIEENKCN